VQEELAPLVEDAFGRLAGVVPELPDLPSWAPARWTKALADRLVAGSPRARREAAEGIVGLMQGRPADWLEGQLGAAVACGLAAAGDRIELDPVGPSQAARIVGVHFTYLHRMVAAGRLESHQPASGRATVALWPVLMWVAARHGCGGAKP